MRILYLISSYNLYGGTPKKTLDLIKYSNNECFLYSYYEEYNDFKQKFLAAGAKIYEGFFGNNFYKHIKFLLKIIDENEIEIIQTQFTRGEILGYLIKLLRPHVKIIVAFVSPFEPKKMKKIFLQNIYKKIDAFVYVSEYVKKEKIKQFPILSSIKSVIIYNGTNPQIPTIDDFPKLQHVSLLCVSGLVEWKNIHILIKSMKIIIKKNKNIFLYVVGDGPNRINLETEIKLYGLDKNVFLLGYQKNIGALLEQADIYVHPAYAEGFGIAVAEAMMSGKPVIVANAGALPELIKNEVSGLIIDPFDEKEWAEKILKIIGDKTLAGNLGYKAKVCAQENFSVEKYVKNYQFLYSSLLEKK